MARPNKRTRIARAKAKLKMKPAKLIAIYEKRIKTSINETEQEILQRKIEALRNGTSKETPLHKKKIDPALSGPNIPSSLRKKRTSKKGFINIYQGGATGLKK